ncbi:hypothetical protein TNIN_57971 [Trichonephila inaurata madagascariensis]|uniref:Uncharacterized protein n=1 Tax=Trichonephila inaurata madagascariensis TaxID=2747483 RepID=A0A8X6X5J2_9ARAC|nr:hypothetical protein TNIN_57971 [Trichonephila inaurata madagascariensis]
MERASCNTTNLSESTAPTEVGVGSAWVVIDGENDEMAPRDIGSDQRDDCHKTVKNVNDKHKRIKEKFPDHLSLHHVTPPHLQETEDEEEDCKRQSGRERTPSGQPRTQIRERKKKRMESKMREWMDEDTDGGREEKEGRADGG